MAFWDADTIRFMIDACEYAPYNRELAAYIGPRLAPGAHVCDAGCGLGYLSLELARHAGRVTAVDRSPEALAVLRRCPRSHGTICLAVCCATAAGLLAVHLAAPQLYETSALGGWALAFTGFGGFFVRELVFLLQKRKGEAICGIAA